MPGSTNMTDWRWHYSSDSSGPSVQFTYQKWGLRQPNNWNGEQFIVSLQGALDFDFNDVGMAQNNYCHLCECSNL